MNSEGQRLILVLAALYENHRVRLTLSKAETIAFIEGQGWYDIRAEDKEPYETPPRVEPRWHTQIAFAKQRGVKQGYVMDVQRAGHDKWQLALKGAFRYGELMGLYKSGEYDVRKCYLWTPAFKKCMCPTYEPSDADALRPDEERKRRKPEYI